MKSKPAPRKPLEEPECEGRAGAPHAEWDEWHDARGRDISYKPPKPRKPRGVVARFLAGESLNIIAMSLRGGVWSRSGWVRVEAILRRELRKKGSRRDLGSRAAARVPIDQERVR